MNDVIEGLKAERAALRDRLARIEIAIEEYERWARSAAELIGVQSAPLKSAPRSAASHNPKPIDAFTDAVRALFGRTSAPLKRADVHEALKLAGVEVGGKDPLNTVASRLSRMTGITNLKGHGYWAEDRPYPPAGYKADPSSDGSLFDVPDEAGHRAAKPAGTHDVQTTEP